jgi:hypothetical protein
MVIKIDPASMPLKILILMEYFSPCMFICMVNQVIHLLKIEFSLKDKDTSSYMQGNPP